MKSLNNYHALIFDFDGVLADSFETIIELVKNNGNPDITHEQFLAHHDGNVFEKPAIDLEKVDLGHFFSQYLQNLYQVLPLFSSKQIQQLAEKYPLFIVSSSSEEVIAEFLDQHELNFFKEVYGVQTDRSKVKKLKMIFDKYNLKPHECLFITDTLGDLLEGKEVGVPTAAVDFGYHDVARLMKGNPLVVFNSPQKLIEQLVG